MKEKREVQQGKAEMENRPMAALSAAPNILKFLATLDKAKNGMETSDSAIPTAVAGV
jgi:hypothetical protein